MKARAGLAWSAFAVTAAAEIAAVVLQWPSGPRDEALLYAVSGVVLAGCGALIVGRYPRHPIGWLFCLAAFQNTLLADLAHGYGLAAPAHGWPAGPAAEWLNLTSWLPSGVEWIAIFLLFPDGRLPGRRVWRWVLPAAVVGCALAVPGWGLDPGIGSQFADGRNPFAEPGVPTGPLRAVGMTLFIGALLVSIASLVWRWRGSKGARRQQLKWFAYAGVLAGLLLPLGAALWTSWPWTHVLPAVALTLLPVAACAAILRYRLYDIDIVINRTLVYGALTALLGAAFGLTILVLGTLLGRGSPVATAVATLVVAVAFRPLRAGVQDGVDRRFDRARYHALRRMADFLDALRAGRAVPEDIHDLLPELTRDPRLAVLFFLPASAVYVDATGSPVGSVDDAAGDRTQLPIARRGEPVAVVLHDPTATLVRTVVQAGGLAIEIARLRVELRRQLAEVSASRVRIVAATDAERRRIERDLHDGAQQRLVSIGLALRHAQHQLGAAGRDVVGEVSRTLDGAVAQAASAIDELRELASGLPPAQLDAGIGPAFRELARQAPVPVLVDAPEGRFDRQLEAAAWFIGCEGLTNAVKHAFASRVALRAEVHAGRLLVAIDDDGVGGASLAGGSGLRGLADRVAALGGTLRISSDVGAGTALTAELPFAAQPAGNVAG